MLGSRRMGRLAISTAQHLHHRLKTKIEHPRSRTPPLRMRSAHEAEADGRDTQRPILLMHTPPYLASRG